MIAILSQACFYVALVFGLFFFIFACKYYFSILIVLFNGRSTRGKKNNWENVNKIDSIWRSGFFENQLISSTGDEDSLSGSRNGGDYLEEPFVSIQLPFYNEKNVVRRIIQACCELDYTNYEVIVVDDSRDETVDILKELNGRKGSPSIKFVHRKDRTGFKGGALQRALDNMDPKTDYILVMDADFVPSPDIIRRFISIFESQNEISDQMNGGKPALIDQIKDNYGHKKNRNNNEEVSERTDDPANRHRVAVVQGYQLHNLNKNENWTLKL